MIPSKASKQWFSFFIMYTMAIFISLVTTRVLLGSEIFSRDTFGLFMIATGSAFISCIGGYLGSKIFFKMITLSCIIGMIYMFYVVLGATPAGFGHLTSIVGYLLIVLAGTSLALGREVISSFVKMIKALQ